MLILMKEPMVDLDGVELRNPIPSGQKNVMGQDIMIEGDVMTLGSVSINALLLQYKGEDNLPGEEKLRRWELAVKIKNGPDPVELTVENVSLIKNLIGKSYGPLICGQAWKLLDQRNLKVV